MALSCGGRHCKQGHEYAIHMVPFLAPISRHHAQPIFITSASRTMHRPAFPLGVEGGVEDWKGATRHILHLICASCTSLPSRTTILLGLSSPCIAHEGRPAPRRCLVSPILPARSRRVEGCPWLGPTRPALGCTATRPFVGQWQCCHCQRHP